MHGLSNEMELELFHYLISMPEDQFVNELSSLCGAYFLYLRDEMVDSFVFEYLDSVYEVFRDALVYKHLPG